MADANVEWVDSLARFDELGAEWDELADEVRLPFARHAWVRAWWRAFGGDRVRICTVRQDGRLAAALPLQARRGRLEALVNGQTPIYSPLGHGDALATALRAALGRRGELRLRLLPCGGPAAALLPAVSGSRRRFVQQDYAPPLVDTRGSFEEYRKSVVDRSARKDVERRRRRLEEAHETTFELGVEPANLDAELEECLQLEAGGWKGTQGTAISSSPDTAAFYRELATSFAAAGRLRFCRIRVDGRLGAFDLCLLDYDRLWLLKGAYDEALRPFGPGLVLTLAEIEHCFASDLEALELLGDAVRWKLWFASETRPLERVHVFRPLPLALAREGYWRVRPQLRATAHRVLGERGLRR